MPSSGRRRVPAQDVGPPTSRPAYQLTFSQVLTELKTSNSHGLHSKDIPALQARYGPNTFASAESTSVIKIIAGQASNAMVLILIIAMGASFAIQDWISGGAILLVVLINISIGFYMVYSAEKTMDSLRSLASPTARVIRDGRSQIIPSPEVVPGDIIELTAGDSVPADLRVIESMNFEADEALLTGESLPVAKDEKVVFEANENVGPGDRINLAYMSSIVSKGRALGVVIATGMSTEIGKIAGSLQKKEKRVRATPGEGSGNVTVWSKIKTVALVVSDNLQQFFGLNVGTPLQQKLSLLALCLLVFAFICALIVFAANNFIADQDVSAYAVVTGISMIPGSLVVVLTITMSVGAKNMVKRHVIVRKLDSLEALGGVTNICSDKTGTLTQGQMFARCVWLPSLGSIQITSSSEPFNPTKGEISFCRAAPDQHVSPEKRQVISAKGLLAEDPLLQRFVEISSLANVATVVLSEEDGTWDVIGNPTEIALQVLACRFELGRRGLTTGDRPHWTELAEHPFSSEVKRMSVVFRENPEGKTLAFVKGAVERVLDICSDIHWTSDGKKRALDDRIRVDILNQMEALASQGLRVLALAYKDMTEQQIEDMKSVPRDEIECDLTFSGLVGIYDPPRIESREAVRKCHSAGISVHMLTGDHAGTAAAIAKEVRILPPNMGALSKDVARAMVMTAAEFDALSDAQIDALPVLPLVIARCAPNTKVRMIEALHRRRAHVAMTGDGVNDSPSLKKADVGIAMGQSGSDVAKDASELVLTDDNFASILNAVEEGRRMFDNIKKFVTHLLAQNVAQAGTLLIGLAFKDANNKSIFPLSSLGVLYVIMVTSSFPAMGLGMERAQLNILERPPHDLRMGIFTWELLCDTFTYGTLIAGLCLEAFALRLYVLDRGQPIGLDCNERDLTPGCLGVFRARAAAFVSLVWFSLFLAWELVDSRRSFFRMQPGSTRHFTQWMVDVWRNQFLFWSIVIMFFSVFIVVHVPGLNTYLFIITGMTGADWGIVLANTVLFFLVCDLYKWVKRVYYRRNQAAASKDLENLTFDKFLTISPTLDKGPPTPASDA